jgi:hypothetical protein
LILNSYIRLKKDKYINQSLYNEKENNNQNNSLLIKQTYLRHNRNKSSLSIKKSSSISSNQTINKKSLLLNNSMSPYLNNKNNSSYYYIRELNRSSTSKINKMKININNLIKKRIILRNTIYNDCYSLIYGKKELKQYELLQQKKLKEVHNKSINKLKEKNNPYSLFSLSKLLDRRYNIEFNTKGFINGVPIIDLSKKHKDLYIDRAVRNNIYVNSKYDLPDIKTFKKFCNSNHSLDKIKKKFFYDSILNLDYNKNKKKNYEEKKNKNISIENSEDEIHFTELKNIFSGKIKS